MSWHLFSRMFQGTLCDRSPMFWMEWADLPALLLDVPRCSLNEGRLKASVSLQRVQIEQHKFYYAYDSYPRGILYSSLYLKCNDFMSSNVMGLISVSINSGLTSSASYGDAIIIKSALILLFLTHLTMLAIKFALTKLATCTIY
eukprot:NODE_22_length_38364_cov_0.248661.p21 type:complete len:144 gc:universal NODE_22_length_38364_cov_0.248661:32445-32876(+)